MLEISAEGALTGCVQNNGSVMLDSMPATLAPLSSGDTSASIEFQALSSPILAPASTVSISQAASTISRSIIPTAGAMTPAPATHNALIIGIAVGVPCGLLVAVLVAAACCSSRVRQKLWFWRRCRDQAPVRDGLPRCDSAATTLTAGSAGISNASSDTVFAACGVRPGQTATAARGRGRLAPGGTRTYDSYELENLRAGYSAGGYLSAV